MENNIWRSSMMREEFDWMFTGQNPDDFAPLYATANGVHDHSYIHHQPPLNTTGDGFLVDQNAFSLMNKQQQLLEIRSHSILDYSDRYQPLLPPYNPQQMYDSGRFDHRSSLNGIPEALSDRNLEIIFNRLNISPRNHQLSSRSLSNVLDQNPSRFEDSIDNRLLRLRPQPKRSKFPACLKDLRGKVWMVAKDQDGCQFLQNKCEEGKVEDVEMIFDEIKDHVCEVMTDASMNYLAQKLFKVCNERQMTHVVSVIKDDDNLTNICLNSHGTRAMQKLIELLTSAEQRFLMVSALSRITVTLTKNTNGHHVIQHCLKSFHVDQVQPILNVVADNCLDIATDKSGCCVLQQCVVHANGLSKERLMSEIIENALRLSEHPYGNYVVQYILGMQVPEATAGIMQKLAGNFVHLAMNKYGSNVVEKCLKDASDDHSMRIIREIINTPNFLSLIQHPFGNYVAQSALQTAKGAIREVMINKVQKEYPLLHSHPHGKRVLALARNSKPRGS